MEKSELPCSVILAILGVGVFAAIFLVNYPVNSNEWASWAAWVQAFGSIGAIMAAYFLGERQAKRSEMLQRSLAQDEAEQRRAAFYAIADSTQHLARDVVELFTPIESWSDVRFRYYDDSMVDTYMQALSAVPVHEIGSAVAVREFIALNENLSKLKLTAKFWIEVYENRGLTLETRDKLLTGYLTMMGSVIEALSERVDKIHRAMYPAGIQATNIRT